MSYMLDALRRADAQRARGAVPTLHAPALGVGGAGPADSGPRPRRFGPGLAAAVLALLLVAAAVGGWMARPSPPAGPTTASPTPSAPATAATIASPPAAPPLAAAVPTPQVPVATASVRPTPAAPVRQAPPADVAQSAPAGGPAVSPTTLPAPAVPAPARPAVASAPVLATGQSVPPRGELPPDVQRQLPALAVSGTVYSSDPSQRLLMVNGELLHEGDRIGPDLLVEEIRRKDAVLRYKGQRFSVSP